MKEKDNKNDERIEGKILVVEPNIRYKGGANKAYFTPTFAHNYEVAIEKLDSENYDAVISTLSFDKDSLEGIEVGKRCLEKNIPFTILANGEKSKIHQLRSEFYDDKNLVEIVGKEDPVKELICPLIGFDKTNPDVWEIAFNYARAGIPVEAMK